MMVNKKALPFGVITISLFAVAAMYSWLNQSQSQCKVLEENMTQGYFMRWMEPQLLLVTANKQSLAVEAENKEAACTLMLKELRIE